MVRKGITARSLEVDDDASQGGKGEGMTSSAGQSLTPAIQPPLMDVLENKAPEPMSLRSMLRFARENVSYQCDISDSDFENGDGPSRCSLRRRYQNKRSLRRPQLYARRAG